MADASVLYGVNTTQNTSSSATFVDGASIAAASFEANKEYLIIASCMLKSSTGSSDQGSRIVHGTTPTVFDDAMTVHDPASSDERLTFGWMFRFTQPGTTEDVKVQFNLNSGSGTVTHLLSQIIAIKLSDDFTENTDFYWNEDLTDHTDAAASAMTTRASITIPGNGSDRWLIIGQASWDVATAAINFGMRLQNTTDAVTLDGSLAVQGYPSQDATNDLYNHLNYVGYVVPSGNKTIAVQTMSATTETVRSTRIFALNLTKFAQLAYNLGTGTPGATWTTMATVAPTPDATGNWVILSSYIGRAAGTNNMQSRLQENASGGGLSSDPAYGDTGPDNIGSSTSREMMFNLFTVKSLSSGASRTINLDVQAVSGITTYGQQIIAFPVVLATTAADESICKEQQVIDETYDENCCHDFSGWQSWITPDDVLPPEDISIRQEFPAIDDAYYVPTESRGWQSRPLSLDNDPIIATNWMPLISEAYEEEHNYDGFVLAPMPEDVQDFQPVPEATPIDGTYILSYDYRGWQARPLSADVVDFQALPELALIDETYDEEHDYSGFVLAPLAENVEDFMPLPELAVIDETYYEEHDYRGFTKAPAPIFIPLSKPTLFELAGWEHGTSSIQGGGLAEIIDAGATAAASAARTGNYGLNINYSGTAACRWVLPVWTSSHTRVVGSFRIRFNTLPSAGNQTLVRFSHNGTGTGEPAIGFRTATGRLCVGGPTTDTAWSADTVDFGPTIQTGVWYQVDFDFLAATTTWTLTAKVDGANEGTCTETTNATNGAMTQTKFGSSSTAGSAYNYDLDDWVLSATAADYPIGPVIVVKLSPNSDGTHNAGTNIMEDAAGNDIGVVTAWDLLDDIPMSAGGTGDRVQQSAVGASNYAEVLFEHIDALTSYPIDVMGYLNYSASSNAQADNGACIAIDGNGTQTELYGTPASPKNMQGGQQTYVSAFIPRPASEWNVTDVDVLKARMGYSTDVFPIPYWLALMFEVAGIELVTPAEPQAPRPEYPDKLADTYSDEWMHDYAGWVSGPLSEDVPPEVPPIAPEVALIDETYYEVYDYSGAQLPATEELPPEPWIAPVLPQMDETYDQNFGHDFSGLFGVPVANTPDIRVKSYLVRVQIPVEAEVEILPNTGKARLIQTPRADVTGSPHSGKARVLKTPRTDVKENDTLYGA